MSTGLTVERIINVCGVGFIFSLFKQTHGKAISEDDKNYFLLREFFTGISTQIKIVQT